MPNDETLQEKEKLAIKFWLRRNDFDYTWLAEQCKCKEATVRNWMSRRTIPDFQMATIKELMKEYPVSGGPGGNSATTMGGTTTSAATTTMFSAAESGMTIRQQVVTEYTIALTPDMKKRLDEKAASCGMSSDAYLMAIINTALNS